ncbi:transcriptional coactivator p15/PC4 family protein [Bradyrhizobium erythrophlei]|uniref:Transcriptional Coactivator p15 (PC4) n=1 Tax=Bradyrhizobium erythrophlei TaxID=1437360 RepID=A0A1M5SIL2_9BRAD|nr:transcriptional coactivator p15/PC4 family protein [Bradyrhizobium erythrophlei]SHH38376.1 Transcriptional Coactivator p15 (PC4) [Bradyrhizobium erythrophlei]
MSARRPTLDEPVVISKFWKNRRHDAVIVSLSTYEGHNLVDLRTHAMKEGRLVPTPKGLAVVVRRLPELVDALTKALAKARELGLIDSDGASEATE